MKMTLRYGFACALALALAACGGSEETTTRPTVTMGTIQSATVPVPLASYTAANFSAVSRA